ncbi:MAG: PspC domain-containing protein [Patescibacteria group bacterium]
MKNTKKLYRSSKDRMLFGVCGGLAEYLNIDSIIVRLVFIILLFGGGSGLLIYLVCAVLIPSEKGAINRAEVYEVGEKVKNITKENDNGRFLLGAFLIFLGFIYFFSNFFDLSKFWSNFWPLALVLLGLIILFKRK